MAGKVEVRGTGKVLAALEQLARQYPKAVMKAVTAEGAELLRESVRLCPVDTGRLRASAYEKPKDETHIVLGYGADYALAVHEKTEVHHENGTQAKFLSAPIDAHRHTFASEVAQRIKSDGGMDEIVKGTL
jgi:hypothetical protein